MYNILVVEGKRTLGIELISALTEDDNDVVGVSDYFEALGRLDGFKPDMVIMNIELPLLDGWEACYWLRQTFGIPIILLGGDTNAETWIGALRAEADFYLRVPFSWQELTARVKAILGLYK